MIIKLFSFVFFNVAVDPCVLVQVGEDGSESLKADSAISFRVLAEGSREVGDCPAVAPVAWVVNREVLPVSQPHAEHLWDPCREK